MTKRPPQAAFFMAQFFQIPRKKRVVKRFSPFLLVLLVSCGDNVKFTQLQKDLDKLLKPASNDTVLYRQNLPDALERKEVKHLKRMNSGEMASLPTNLPLRQELVAYAMRYKGTPYLFASSDPQKGFDCSGFINFVFNNYNFDVPRSSKDFEFFGRTVSINEAREGDLVLFTGTDKNDPTIGHIGILINREGMKSEFIHSSSGRANGVTVSSLEQPGYTKRFVKVISVID